MTTDGTNSGRLLVHACCGPCLLVVTDVVETVWPGRPRGSVAAHFYNPNIHPLIEFRRRLKAVRVLQESVGIEIHCDEDYGLETWLRAVDWSAGNRCEQCYRLRLRRTARMARELGFEAFTTSLLVSTHQQHEVLRRVGEATAEESGVPFVYRDLRPYHSVLRERARAKGLYLQSYCGCIFSESERYRDTKLHLYKGPGGPGHEREDDDGQE